MDMGIFMVFQCGVKKMPESAKKLIEIKKTRLNKLVGWEYISREQANRQLKEYAQFVCRYYGC